MFDGMKHTDETRLKISKSIKRSWKRRKREKAANGNSKENECVTKPSAAQEENLRNLVRNLPVTQEDMQKIQVKADLERMVYNYALLGKIENDTATEIVSFIDAAIGGGDFREIDGWGKIIAFPQKQSGAGFNNSFG